MLVRPKKHINVDIDTRIIAIQGQREGEERVEEEHDHFYIPALDNRNIKNITIKFALANTTKVRIEGS